MARFLSLATREAVISEADEQIAGFCIGHRFPRNVARIITLDVRAGARRSGLGRSLLEQTVALLTRAGARETVLEVDVRNRGAVAFYSRLGFESRGRISDYYGPGLAALEMSRSEKAPGDAFR